MTLKTTPFDPAEYLDDPKEMAAYLESALETGDTDFILASIGVVARAKGMTRIAEETGLSRQALYRALNTGGNPEFGAVIKVLAALGVTLTAKATKVAEGVGA
jgi:probable addiction module antidote protein